MADTRDLVHDVLLRTLPRLASVDAPAHGALGAYLQEAVRNRLRDEYRRMARRGGTGALRPPLCDPAPSPFDVVMARERTARYRAALARLNSTDQEVIVAHVELDYSHEQLGCMLGRSPNAARMALRRAIGRLAAQMREP